MEVATREIKQNETNLTIYLFDLERIWTISVRRTLKNNGQFLMYNF